MTSATERYDPRSYWDGLLADDFTVRGVGYPELPVSFNRLIVRAMLAAATETIDRPSLASALELRVLDVGAGTGVWVDFWHRRGVRRVVGIDLTPASVSTLRERFPSDEFLQGDISSIELGSEYVFDVVSAMNVLLHITDDELFERAIGNIAAALKPGGVVLAMDPLVIQRWWGPDLSDAAPAKPRTLEQWRSVLTRHELELVESVPVTYLMASVVDTKRRASFRALTLYWHLLTKMLGRNERAGALTGKALFAIDRVALRVGRTGPSAKCMLIRKTAG